MQTLLLEEFVIPLVYFSYSFSYLSYSISLSISQIQSIIIGRNYWYKAIFIYKLLNFKSLIALLLQYQF